MLLSQFLDELELNSYEKKVILFLAKVDSASAQRILRESAVPQGRIYDVLNSLIKKRIVTAHPGKPKVFGIIDVKEGLKNYLLLARDKIEEEISQLDKIELQPKVYLKESSNFVEVLVGREEHLRKIIEFRNSAQKELLQVAPSFVGTFASNLALEKALQRGVKIQVITSQMTSENKRMVKTLLSNGGELKVLPNKDLLVLQIKDQEELIIGVHGKGEERTLIYSRNKALLETSLETFRKMWKSAKRVKK